MILRLTDGQLDDITAQAHAAAPAEACGLLVGVEEGENTVTVTRILPAKNLMADQPGRFELDPCVRLAAEKQCRGAPGQSPLGQGIQERVIGHWHSHPNGMAQPSAIDLSMAFEPELIWLIVATPDTDAKAFHLDSTTMSFAPVPLCIEKRTCIPPAIPT